MQTNEVQHAKTSKTHLPLTISITNKAMPGASRERVLASLAYSLSNATLI